MRKIVIAGFVSGVILLVLSVLGLYTTIWLFPNIALQYFDPAFSSGSDRFMLYFMHPFI